jgi:hypothetical protein
VSSGYRIADEPQPSKWKSLATSPLFPLLAAMLAGQWLAWPWFILNGIAMGSPTRAKELRIILLALGGSVVGAFVVLVIPDENELGWRLAALALTTWKLACAMVVHNLQARTWELFQHFEGNSGQGRIGLGGVAVGAFIVRPLLFGVIDSLFLKLIIAGGLGL